MARHQGVEEMPQRRQRQILGGVRSGNLLNEAPGQPRRDLTQLDSLFFAPGEEAANDAGVGAAGVRIGDAGGEELIGGEQGVLPGAPQDGGSGGGAIEGLGGGPKGGLGRGLIHGDIGDDKILYRALLTRPPPLPPASAVARFNPGVSRAADPPVSCLGPQEKSKPEFRM